MRTTQHQTGAIIAGALLVLTATSLIASGASAAGLNTNVALTAPEDGFIIRIQWRHTAFDDPTSLDRDVDSDVIPFTAVYGLTADLDFIVTVPIVRRDLTISSAGIDRTDTGFGDIPLLAKYRFYQDDKPGVTTRLAAIGGVEISTYDNDFSSDSFDPIIGVVFTHQRRDWWFDVDLLYKLNTGSGLNSDDELRGDAAFSYRLLGGESETIGPWGLYAIAEINTVYLTDGSHQVFGSPGLQIITPNLILEGGIQLPMSQDMKSSRLETDYTFVLSARFQF